MASPTPNATDAKSSDPVLETKTETLLSQPQSDDLTTAPMT
ncbi:MAG: hypothetical protein ACFCVD_21580 [Nodosilinea sp.]